MQQQTHAGREGTAAESPKRLEHGFEPAAPELEFRPLTSTVGARDPHASGGQFSNRKEGWVPQEACFQVAMCSPSKGGSC